MTAGAKVDGEEMEVNALLHQFLTGMYYTTNNTRDILKAAEVLAWFSQFDMAEFLTGERGRKRFIEYQLPRLVERGKLTLGKAGRKHVYTKHKLHESQIPHGLICTRILLKLVKCKAGDVVSESFFKKRFKKFGMVPDGGMLYTDTLLLFEYSTNDNTSRDYLMKKKLKRYRENLHLIEKAFGVRVIILFVLDVMRFELYFFIEKFCTEKDEKFFFIDRDSFFGVKDGYHLTAHDYLWAVDSKRGPLSDD